MLRDSLAIVFLVVLLTFSALVCFAQKAPAAENWTRISQETVSELVWCGTDLYGINFDDRHVYRYEGGTSWTDIKRPEHLPQTLSSVKGTLYVGCYEGYFYRYDSGSNSWVDCAYGLGSPIYSLEGGGDTLYVGTGSGDIYRYDGGTSLTCIGQPEEGPIGSLVWTGDTLYASGPPLTKVYRYDGGTTWTDTGLDADGIYIMTIEWNGSNLYAGYGNEIYRYDGSNKWTNVGKVSVSNIYSLAWNGTNMYAGCKNGHVFRYDGGTNWTDSAVIGSENAGFLTWDGGANLYVSCDGVYVLSLPSSTWYIAEGTSDWGFETYVTIENPNDSDVTAAVTYMTKSGPETRPDIALPAMSQTVINPRNDLGSIDFSTKVECKEGKTIAVDRRMIWTGTGAITQEGHCSIGVTFPSQTWYLPEGSSKWGFETWLLIQNPNSHEVSCDITYMIEGKDPVAKSKKIPANSRSSFNMAEDIGAEDASIKVESNAPVIPERAMYRNSRREGHDSIGTTTPANDYFLAEGCTGYGPGFVTYVLVQNPQNEANRVTLTYFTGSGEKEGPEINMEPNSRKTVRVNDQVDPNTDVSILVHGDKPIIAERAMYWNVGLGEACHDSIGMSSPHKIFYLPDGEVGAAMETWTLVQNPNDTDVKVEISYLTPTGTGNKTLTENIPAKSRKSFNMVDKGITGRAAVLVVSKTEGMKIMCERSMYWNSRGAGTDTIGGYSD